MVKPHTICRQTSDMGSDYVDYEMTEDMTLKEILDWIKENIRAFGTITIKYRSGEVLRKFDYNLYHENDKSFYYNFSSWEDDLEVYKMTSQACFMNCNFEITLRFKLTL